MIACDPSQVCDVWLPEDEDVPADVRPTFIYRHMTAREVLDREQKFQAAGKLTTDAERIPAFATAVAVGLVGWRNVNYPDNRGAIPFDIANIPDALSPLEMGAMFAEAGQRVRLSEVEKKVSRLAARTEVDSSAASAAPADAA